MGDAGDWLVLVLAVNIGARREGSGCLSIERALNVGLRRTVSRRLVVEGI